VRVRGVEAGGVSFVPEVNVGKCFMKINGDTIVELFVPERWVAPDGSIGCPTRVQLWCAERGFYSWTFWNSDQCVKHNGPATRFLDMVWFYKLFIP
jgi:hypothetical protein